VGWRIDVAHVEAQDRHRTNRAIRIACEQALDGRLLVALPGKTDADVNRHHPSAGLSRCRREEHRAVETARQQHGLALTAFRSNHYDPPDTRHHTGARD
jgi:hypothetical protein